MPCGIVSPSGQEARPTTQKQYHMRRTRRHLPHIEIEGATYSLSFCRRRNVAVNLTDPAIAPLIIIWVQDTRTALVLCAVVVAIFPIVSDTTLGLRSVDPRLIDLFRMNRATRFQLLWRLRIPSALPYFFGGLRIASGLALIGAVVAEFVAGTGGQGAGLAYQILMAGIQLNIPRLFAALVLITLAGVAFYSVALLLSQLALGHWHESELGRR